MIILVEHLCARDHCIMAIAYNDETDTLDKAIEMIKDMEGLMQINQHCAICGSQELRFAPKETGFQTMVEASGFISNKMVEQGRLRRKLEAGGRMFDQTKN